MINDDGNVYQGNFLYGVKEDKGIAKWSDGSKYEGKWKRGFCNGCREVVKRIFIIIIKYSNFISILKKLFDLSTEYLHLSILITEQNTKFWDKIICYYRYLFYFFIPSWSLVTCSVSFAFWLSAMEVQLLISLLYVL